MDPEKLKPGDLFQYISSFSGRTYIYLYLGSLADERKKQVYRFLCDDEIICFNGDALGIVENYLKLLNR